MAKEGKNMNNYFKLLIKILMPFIVILLSALSIIIFGLIIKAIIKLFWFGFNLR